MDLSGLVRHYISNHRPRKRAELDWSRSQASMEDALECAALAIDGEVKRFAHQRRITNEALRKACTALTAVLPRLRLCEDFDTILAIVESAIGPVYGVGEMYAYDVALRLGAKLDRLPTKVYLHRGTREGAKRLRLAHRSRSLEPT